MADNVRVAVRVRPFSNNSREIARKASLIIHMNGKQTEITDPENSKEKPKQFAFDYSYWSHDDYAERADGYLEPSSPQYADQKKVFTDLGIGVLNNAWKGYNCSLFAYGQTGSGKSYSMVGYGSNKGIVPLACEELFRGIEEKKQTAKTDEEYQVKVSMLEIYNEQVRDLLNLKSSQKGGLKVRQDPKKGFYVENLTTWPVGSYIAIDNKINEGTRNRTVASTNMNATSSRAHTIVAVTFVQKTFNEANQSMTKTSIINLVDLAGSERADSTGATGDRLKEGSQINQSLSALGNCIKALADQATGKKKVVVPFRDSVLTKLLQNALGGNSKTIMIAALSPADINYDETLSTLRFADRAKAIKTQAMINESPTDKLIRELREEVARLKKIQGGAVPAGIEGDRDEEIERLKKQLEEQMKENEMTWAQKLEQAKAASQNQEKQEQETQENRKTRPHFWNLNEDAALTGMIIHFIQDGRSRVGRKDAPTPPEIQLSGLSIQKEHAEVENRGGVISLTPSPGARVLINGETVKDTRTLHHHDRVLLGSNHLYVFQHPVDESKQRKEGTLVDTPTYDSAQEEIMKKAGLFQEAVGADGKSKEDLLLQEDLIQLLPMVNEANAMSEELDKKVKFEIALISPQARGLTNGRTEVNVKMRNLESGNEWMFDRNDFINRKYLMQEMYQNFMEGSPDWDVEKEKDPFWEPSSTNVQIGTVHVYLQSLAHMIEVEENLAVANYKGEEQAHLNIEIMPCTSEWKDSNEDFIEYPFDVLAEKRYPPLYFKLKIPSARGIPQRFIKTYCRYRFYLDEEWTETEVISGTMNPNFNHEKCFTFKPVTKQLLEYLNKKALVVEVWGQQKPDKSEQGGQAKAAKMEGKKASPTKTDAKLAAPASGNTTKALMSREKTTLGVGATAATTVTVKKEDKEKQEQEKYKTAHEINTYKKIAERAESRLGQLQGLIQTAKVSGSGTIQVADLEAIIAGSDVVGKNSTSNNVAPTKRPGSKQGSQTCSVQ